jgi:peptide/nickel transport system substrate-binding protein
MVCGGEKLPAYPYDPEEAKRLIKEGGFEGHEFTVISYPRADTPEYPRVVEAVAGYWQKIGLKPKIRMSEYSTWRKAWRSRKTQNTVHGYDDTTNPECASMILKCRQKWFSEEKRSTVNIPELDKKFQTIAKSLDITEVEKLMGEIHRYVYDNYLMVPIAGIPDKIATTKKVPKWDPGHHRRDTNYRGLIKQE